MASRLLLLVGVASLLLLLSACGGAPDTGPAEVKWDRTTCERCRMVVSDRKHAAQVRYLPENKKRSRVMHFDDIGCAVIWLEDKPWKDDPKTEIWVTDRHTGEWLDARSATYIKGDLTPMEYGLGAQAESASDGLDFEQASAHIFDVEKRFNIHGVNLLSRLQERQQARESGEQEQDVHKHGAEKGDQ